MKVFPYHDRDYLPHSLGLYTLANNLLRGIRVSKLLGWAGSLGPQWEKMNHSMVRLRARVRLRAICSCSAALRRHTFLWSWL